MNFVLCINAKMILSFI